MKKPKLPFNVYSSYEYRSESWNDNYRDKWVFEGQTRAVSEAQAINNVRKRNGYKSQYYPLHDNGYSVGELHWKAVLAFEPAPIDESYNNSEIT